MKLTEKAKAIQALVEASTPYEDYPQDLSELASCMGTEDFGYSLFDGGYLKPEDWIEGEDLIKLQEAVELVGKFANIIRQLHFEI